MYRMTKTEFVDVFFYGQWSILFDNAMDIAFWYAAAFSNLADILRKGTKGYPKDLKRAFELYRVCGLPYAHYRVGEFYENGWGTEKNLELAKAYYRQAYQEGHFLAKKKLSEWNFLE